MSLPQTARRLALALSATVVLSACAAGSSEQAGAPFSSRAHGWQGVLERAKGQTVNWQMYGGDATLNRFVNGYVADHLKALGITLNQVKITDTAEAVNTVLGEKQAGRTTQGAVDAIWINGENFATGVQADLWACGWVATLPNARFFDATAPANTSDFGTPVNGCEAPWQQANSALVYDGKALSSADVASLSTLVAWARAHPGHFAYPAPPDFTGSLVVRTFLYDQLSGPGALAGAFDEQAYAKATSPLWPTLRSLQPSLWRKGSTYPRTQDAVEKLYAEGEISAYFTYGPGAVADKVRKGTFPASTRETVPSGGNIANTSFVAIPKNSPHQAAAMVLANLLEDPQTQLELYRAEGTYPAIDLSRTAPEVQAAFRAVPTGPAVLPLEALLSNTRPELQAAYVSRLEKDWKAQVLQR